MVVLSIWQAIEDPTAALKKKHWRETDHAMVFA
jgi:hypothetical protein